MLVMSLAQPSGNFLGREVWGLGQVLFGLTETQIYYSTYLLTSQNLLLQPSTYTFS